MSAVKSVARRKSAVGKSAVAVKPVRARAARAVAVRAAKPRRKVSAAAAAPSAPSAHPAPAASVVAQAEVCPVCGAAKLNGAAQAQRPAPPERTAKQRAADRAWLRRLYKKYPPTPLPKLTRKSAKSIVDVFADFRKVAAKHGGIDDLVPQLPPRRNPWQ